MRTLQNKEARADFFLSVAQAMVCQNTDWELKYYQRHERTSRTRRNFDDSDSVDAYLPGRNVHHDTTINATINTDVCQPCAFNVVPYHKKSKNCQIFHYEMRREKWKGVVLCTKHGVHLCTQIHGPRNTSEPTLVKVDGTDVTDICGRATTLEAAGYHDFYEPQGLFTKTKIDLTSDKIKFGSYCYSSDLYENNIQHWELKLGERE
jgi:hypothetical protein